MKTVAAKYEKAIESLRNNPRPVTKVAEEYGFNADVFRNYLHKHEPDLAKQQGKRMTEDGKYIANLFGQEDFGYDGKRYTSYDALYEAMVSLADFCKENNLKWISIPRFIGCGRGGGSTRIVSSIIEEAFRNCHIMLEFWTLASDDYRTIYNS